MYVAPLVAMNWPFCNVTGDDPPDFWCHTMPLGAIRTYARLGAAHLTKRSLSSAVLVAAHGSLLALATSMGSMVNRKPRAWSRSKSPTWKWYVCPSMSLMRMGVLLPQATRFRFARRLPV